MVQGREIRRREPTVSATSLAGGGDDELTCSGCAQAHTKYVKALRYLDKHRTLAERNLELEQKMVSLRVSVTPLRSRRSSSPPGSKRFAHVRAAARDLSQLSLYLNAAMSALKMAAPTRPADARVAIEQCDAALKLDGTGEMQKTFTDGDRAKVYYRRGLAQVATSDHDKAIADFELALKNAPKDSGIQRE